MNRDDFNIGDKVKIKASVFINETGIITAKLVGIAIIKLDNYNTRMAIIYSALKKI